MFMRNRLLQRIADAIERQNEILVKAIGLHYYKMGASRYKACYESVYNQLAQSRSATETQDAFGILTDVVDHLIDDDFRADAQDLLVDLDYLACSTYDTTQILADARREMDQKTRQQDATPA